MTFGTQINDGAAAADTEPSAFLGNVQPVPAVEKARAEFERAQKVEERFHKEFDVCFQSKTTPTKHSVDALTTSSPLWKQVIQYTS
jgi:hypothetical protein